MARPWRIQFPGAIYHVTARGNNRQALFLQRRDYTDWLDLLARGRDRFQLQIFAFCLMSNHYHLFLRTSQANLAAALQWLNTTYAVHFHRRHRRSGHLFQGRYKSVLVADEAHWLHLSIYLHLNPVRAGLVTDPVDYEWSSFRDYTRHPSRYAWLDPDPILSAYGSHPAQRRRHYRRECLGLLGQPPSFWQELREGVILGTIEQLRELARQHPPRGRLEAVSRFRRAGRTPVILDQEIERLEHLFGEKILQPVRGRRGFLPRLAAYYHLVEHCAVAVTQVADRMGVSAAAVSQGIVRFQAKLRDDRNLRLRMATLP